MYCGGARTRVLPLAQEVSKKWLSTTGRRDVKVAVLGASGGIGQPLSLLLKNSPLVTELSLFDIVHTMGVAADLSHINTPAKVKGFNGPENLDKALKGMEVVVIPAGVPRKPGMTRDDLFGTNASIVRDLSKAIAANCPKAMVCIITNPVNSTVPIACEVLKKQGVFDPNRVFGVSTLDSVRTSAFIGELKKIDPRKVNVPVIGGHSGVTIIPLLSLCEPKTSFTEEEIGALTPRIQDAGTEVVKAKAGTGSATLSMAFAGARFAESVCRAINGESNIVECAYVQSSVVPGVTYFATPIQLGPNGVSKNLGLGTLSPFEKQLLEKAVIDLKKEIKKGEEFVNKS